MTDGRDFIGAGPGFVGPLDAPNEFSADVELELAYGDRGDGSATVASLILRATNVEPPFSSMGMGVELTKADLIWLHNKTDAMIVAAEADEDDA